MSACHATDKCGLSFEGWSSRPGFERYFHPFPSMLDNLGIWRPLRCDAARPIPAQEGARARGSLQERSRGRCRRERRQRDRLREHPGGRDGRGRSVRGLHGIRRSADREDPERALRQLRKTNSRSDTEYWRANAANGNLSDNLRRIYSDWKACRSIVAGVRAQVIGIGYSVVSRFALMAGMGVFPDPPALRPPAARQACYDMSEIDDLLGRSAGNCLPHREALDRIPRRRQPPGLQLDLW